MQQFAIDDQDIDYDIGTLTLSITMTPHAPDFREVDLMEAGWRTIVGLGIRRLIVTVMPAGSPYSTRN